jgi:hypothetical protein
MALSLEKYSTGDYPFPKDEINPKDKNEDWGRQWCEAIYARWKRGMTAIPYSSISEMRALRELADGRQNILQYQKILLDESEDGADMQGYMNINWDVFSVMPKFLRVVEGMMEQTDHQIVATAVDPSSTDEREAMKLDMEYRMKFKEAVDYIEKGLGIDRSNEYIPETMEELNLYDGAGGFKLAKETEIEQGVDYTFYISAWKEIKKKIIRDLCVVNCAGTKDYTDPYTSKVKVRYVDPENYIGQYSKHWDNHNSEFGGEIIQVLISDIRKLNIDGVNENMLLNLARDYVGVGNNTSEGTFSYNSEDGTCNYDSFLVDVMDIEWFSVDSKYMTTRNSGHGEGMIYEEKWGKVYNDEKKKTEKYDIKVVYKCRWIIGTDIVYDFGLQHDIPRPGKKEVELSYHLYKLPFRSLVSLSETHLHQMAIAYYKLQNAIAMASPPGIAIEWTALQNMTLSKKKMEPLDILKIKTQTGNLIYKATTATGNQNIPGGRIIQELGGGIGAQLQEFISIFQFNTEAIRELTGINQIADASSPNPEQSVGGSQIAMAATNNALRPIYSAYLNLKEQSAKNISLRLQLLIKHNEEAYTGYMPVIGKIGVQIISVGADTVDADYYIKYEARPTDERKATIKDAAIKAMSPDRDGIIGIELPDFLMIERLLESGSLKYAEAYLNYKSKKNKDRQLKVQRENMELDSQREQQNTTLKAQVAESLEKTKTDEQIRLYQAKKQIDEQFAQRQHERAKELLQIESGLGIVQDTAKSQLTQAQSK